MEEDGLKKYHANWFPPRRIITHARGGWEIILTQPTNTAKGL